MNKKTIKIAGWALGLSMAVAGIGAVAGTSATLVETKAVSYSELFSISSDDVVSNSTYTKYETTVGNRDWIVTFGGNNKSIGTNSGNRSNCNLSSYSKYAVSPVTTSSAASAFASTTSLSDVSKISYTFNGGSNQTNTKVYLLYSSNNTTFSQMSLTTGSQGATINSGTEFAFAKTSGYFAVLFEATNNSGNWRIDDVTLTFFTEDAPTETYKVTYDPGRGSGSMDDDSEVAGEYNLKNNSFTAPAGEIFKSWKIEETEYAEGAEVTITANTTVTAQWALPRTVSFNANGGTGSIDNAIVASGNEYILPDGTGLTAPTGKVFGGWKLNNEGDTKSAGTGIGVNSDVVLYAQWDDPAEGSRYNPYSVSEAKSKIDAGTGTSGVYVTGVICQIDSYSDQYHNIEYWISADGLATGDKLLAYHGKNLNNTSFNSIGDIAVGQSVIIYGNLKKYNETYEFDNGNYLVELNDIVPTKTNAELADGKGSYYNGTIAANSVLSTEDFVISSVDDNGFVKDTYDAGTGFTLKVYKNGTLFQTLDATSSAKTYQFSGAEASSPSNVYTVKATVGKLTESDAVEITVVQKDIASYEWTTPQTTEFYAHRDEFVVDGVLKYTFNDTSYTSSGTYVKHTIRAYDEEADNKAGDPVVVPTHTDGTINLSSETKYVIDTYHKDYSSTSHVYTIVTVRVPTLTIEDNYTGSYYVGVERDLDVTVTAHFGAETRVLDSSEYELTTDSVNPASTDDIEVTASWKIDGSVVLASNTLVIEPVESTRVLNELEVTNQSLPAGSYFNAPSSDILLSVTENETDDIEELDQGLVTFTHKDSGKILTSGTRLLKSDAGTIVASYAEGSGVGKEVSCEFELAVTDAVIESYTPAQIAEHASESNSISVGDKVYLASTAAEVQFNGISTTSTKYGLGKSFVDYIDDGLFVLEVVAGSQPGSYAFRLSNGNYLYWGSGNSLNTNGNLTDNSSWTVEYSGTTATITNVATDTRQICWNGDRFACYSSNYGNYNTTQLYKKASTPSSGNEVTYLKSVIDAYRLNNDTEEFSICASSGLYGSTDWAKAKAAFANLTSAQRSELAVQDYYGEAGKTYVDTYEMLIANEPEPNNGSAVIGRPNENVDSTSAAIVAVAGFAVLATGGLFLARHKRKED